MRAEDSSYVTELSALCSYEGLKAQVRAPLTYPAGSTRLMDVHLSHTQDGSTRLVVHLPHTQGGSTRLSVPLTYPGW